MSQPAVPCRAERMSHDASAEHAGAGSQLPGDSPSDWTPEERARLKAQRDAEAGLRLGKYRRRRPQTGAADAGILTTWRWRGYQDAPRIPITTSSALTACKRASRRLVVWARRPPSCRGCGARYAVDNESLYTYLLHPSSVPWMVLT